jgi:hypothetical protein
MFASSNGWACHCLPQHLYLWCGGTYHERCADEMLTADRLGVMPDRMQPAAMQGEGGKN